MTPPRAQRKVKPVRLEELKALRLAEIVMRFDVLMAERHPEHWMPEHARLIEKLRKLGRWRLPVHRSEAAAILTDKPRTRK